MKRIYLDQNKWIDVAAARKGLAKGEPFHDALLLLEAGTEAGHVSLPLSSAHYMETQARRHWESRRDLAATMVALSSLQTIAPLDGILPAEVDRALLQRYGQPAFPRPLLPFGSGASHAFARDIPRYRIPGNLAGLVANAWEFERSANKLQEAILLAGLPPDLESRIPDFEPLAHLKVGENYAAGKEELRARRVAENWNKGERADRIAKAQAFSDHLEVLDEAFRRAGLQLDRLLDEGQSGMNDFREAVPSLFASSELERLRHTTSQRTWERQDLLDIGALSVASVYCDIVVTERSWVDMARRAGLDERFETTFTTKVSDLPALIV